MDMFIKEKSSISIGHRYFKRYIMSRTFTAKQLLELLLSYSYEILDINVSESVEIDMQVVDGNYTVQRFLECYDTFSNYAISLIEFCIEYQGETLSLMTKMEGDTISFTTSQPDLELDGILHCESYAG